LFDAQSAPESRLGRVTRTRLTPKAKLKGFKTIDECVPALQSGRVDAEILAATIGLSTVGKNATLGPYHLLNTPVVSLPSCYGIQREARYENRRSGE